MDTSLLHLTQVQTGLFWGLQTLAWLLLLATLLADLLITRPLCHYGENHADKLFAQHNQRLLFVAGAAQLVLAQVVAFELQAIIKTPHTSHHMIVLTAHLLSTGFCLYFLKQHFLIGKTPVHHIK